MSKDITLYDYLELTKEWETTVFDKDYDVEVYFYKPEGETDAWDMSMLQLSKLLSITSISQRGCTVNLSDVIGKNIDKLDKLFLDPSLDSIMDSIESILAGNVSERWLADFVKKLSEGVKDVSGKPNNNNAASLIVRPYMMHWAVLKPNDNNQAEVICEGTEEECRQKMYELMEG